jgi:recombination protein RecA
MARLFALPRVSARSLERIETPPLSLAALSGRLVELSGVGAQASLSIAMQWVLEAQKQGELAAWVQSKASCFYPPDAAAAGVDLSALPIVSLEQVAACARAAEQLLRSGAFALVVIDVPAGAQLPMAALSRLLGLAQKHGSALVLISEKKADAASFGSLVALRLHTTRVAQGNGFSVCCEVLKDKSAGPGFCLSRPFQSLPGLSRGLPLGRSV